MSRTATKSRHRAAHNAQSRTALSLAAVLAAPHHRLTVGQYQDLSHGTDRKPEGLSFPLLGLFGETGSLLSELKKKQRDADSYFGYQASVIEELGDVLWYFANLATRAQIKLPTLAHRINGRISDGDAPDMALASLQPSLSVTGPAAEAAFEATLIRLAGEIGKLVADFSAGGIAAGSDRLSDHMEAIFRALIEAANNAGVSLGEAAHRNLAKIYDRWPQERIYPPLFDDGCDRGEQIPRRVEMHIFEKTVNKKTYVFLRCNDINIGDRLTDNKLEKDEYRFHDVFHLAYAAILGWSPVMRALFRVKRKSRPAIDEAEDGARAILIEEGVSTWIFNHAAPLNFFENLTSVEYGLLKAARSLVAGFEAERCPLWLWEEAILKGYEVFRALRQHRRGVVIADLNERTITFEKLPA
ncbi:MAG: nucleoside triphosphate pyrophosphohydrolase family protein [Alphaproteobacteria bacterium]|nr:nucleoside triphosphate pyrophosphohydrolase family protein [Alphaproteobacteria bacterium]